MSIFEKIQNARVLLQSRPLKKTGKNTFAKYEYFELEDFLPTVQVIFKEVGLCGIVTFTTDVATLTVYDMASDANVAFQAPMASADLKGCHNIQNTGAVISYMRRYLWMLALEIVEHDALDAATGKTEKTEQHQSQNELPWYNAFDADKNSMAKAIKDGKRTSEQIINNLCKTHKVSTTVREQIKSLEAA